MNRLTEMGGTQPRRRWLGRGAERGFVECGRVRASRVGHRGETDCGPRGGGGRGGGGEGKDQKYDIRCRQSWAFNTESKL